MSLESPRFCKSTIQQIIDSNIQYLRVYQNYAVIFKEHVTKQSEKQIENITESNKQGRKYNGYMSYNTKSKIRKIIDAWLTAIERYNKAGQGKFKKEKRKPVFVTLTLPYEQFHSDYDIKRKILVPYIQELIKYYNVRYYFWRAEAQKNGNIHFHLIIDSYIHKDIITDTWNRALNKLNYIDAFESKHGHRKPPSTQIQSIAQNSNIISYIIKYSTKHEEGRIILGRIWGCSDELRNLNCYTEIIDNEKTNALNDLIASYDCRIVNEEHFTVIYFPQNFQIDGIPKTLLSSINKYYSSLYSQLYDRPMVKYPTNTLDENT